jgi:Flp pilus assembly secretin CpaC
LPNNSAQTEAQRIKLVIGQTQNFPLAMGIQSIIIVAPEIAEAKKINGQIISISSLKVGGTLLIISGNQKRFAYIIEVIGKPSISERQNAIAEMSAEINKSNISGTVNFFMNR